ncbi:hypothetical protein SAMN05660880_02936 [Luteibacter sp. 22Crub2.1]|nr:hypothetical protein SAMN05660880_02936 [Luteibacter sp. 22Crub2.1]
MRHQKKVVVLIAFGLLSAAALAAQAGSRGVPAGTCQIYTRLEGLSGRLQSQQFAVVREWRTGCTGSVMASAGRGYLSFEQFQDGAWRPRAEGISVNLARLPPGTYRLRVKNINHTPLDYLVRLSYGIG